MKKFFGIVLITLLLFSLVGIAEASLIIDTGIPTETNGGPVLGDAQFLAGEIYLDQDYYITDIYGYMTGHLDPSATTGSLSLVIYGDLGSTPDRYDEIFVGSFSVPQIDIYETDWYGMSDLNLFLQSGNYWIAFEVRTGDTYVGGMPRYSPNPLNGYAFFSLSSSSWADWNSTDLGFQVYGQTDNPAVPIPGPVWLLGSGLLGLTGLRRKFKHTDRTIG